MKQLCGIFFVLFIVGCSGASEEKADFRTAEERMNDERKGSILGKDALKWEWGQNKADKAAVQDPMWVAASAVLAQHPVSFSNFHARIIQTDWIALSESSRYRVTVRTTGVEPKKDNINLTVLEQVKQNGEWRNVPVADRSLQQNIESKIIMEATRIYDSIKRD